MSCPKILGSPLSLNCSIPLYPQLQSSRRDLLGKDPSRIEPSSVQSLECQMKRRNPHRHDTPRPVPDLFAPSQSTVWKCLYTRSHHPPGKSALVPLHPGSVLHKLEFPGPTC